MAIYMGTSEDDTLRGGEPADEISGFQGNDLLEGLAGDDTLSGADGRDTLLGGDGESDVLWGGEGDDSIDGGPGAFDLALFNQAIQPVTVSLATGLSSGKDGNDTLTGIERVLGSNFNDDITGSDVVNTLWGELGNDSLSGLAGGDALFGGAGEDTLRGGDDNDLLDGGAGNDQLDGGAGVADIADFLSAAAAVAIDLVAGTAIGTDGTDSLSGIEYVRGSAFGDAVDGSSIANGLYGGAGDDALRGLGGDDTLAGGPGADTLDGGAGSADRVDYSGASGAVTVDLAAGTASGADGSDVLSAIEAVLGSAYADSLYGGGAADLLIGERGNDSLRGLGGADSLAGGAGNDTITGGAGDDKVYFGGLVGNYQIGVTGGVITVIDLEPAADKGGDDGTDTLREVEALVFADRVILITDLDNENDTIDLRGPGGGTIAGGKGDDTFLVDDPGDNPVEFPGEGTDTVRADISWTLEDNIEILLLTGIADIDGTGNGASNTVTGNAGVNVLDGGPGADSLSGGAGADTYFVDDPGDQVIEDAIGDLDTLVSSIGRILLAPNVEIGRLAEAGMAGELSGNALANQLFGNSAGDLLSGGGAGDTLDGAAGIDVAAFAGKRSGYTVSSDGTTVTVTDKNPANGDDGVDVLTGIEALRFADVVTALNGTSIKRGTAGAQTIDLRATGGQAGAGAAGNDTYLVNSRADAAIERAGGGTDTVKSSVSWTLWEHLERLQLTGTAAIDGVGNAAPNRLTGNGAANRLSGYEGKDTLNGGPGADTLAGGPGDDTYQVGVGDVLVERADAGLDTARSPISWALAEQVEKLILTGTAATSGTGNAGNNTLVGNGAANRLEGLAGNDTLNGGAGLDTLRGGAGNDVYLVTAGDLIEEGPNAGVDTVQSAVSWLLGANLENLVLTGSDVANGIGTPVANSLGGNAGANRLDGQGGNDALSGQGGDDTLVGGAGNDTLTGAAGGDTFVFDDALGVTTNKDVVADFEAGVDTLRLDDDIFTTLVPGALTEEQFLSGAGVAAAQTSGQRLVYDSSTGTLYYDADGVDGTAPVAFAALGTTVHPAISAADFLIVS